MKIEDVVIGARVRAAGHPQPGRDGPVLHAPDAPMMVVREVVVLCSWFVNGAQHSANFRADELEGGQS
jgi:hypothetical protein